MVKSSGDTCSVNLSLKTAAWRDAILVTLVILLVTSSNSGADIGADNGAEGGNIAGQLVWLSRLLAVGYCSRTIDPELLSQNNARCVPVEVTVCVFVVLQ